MICYVILCAIVVNIAKVNKILTENCHLSLRGMAAELFAFHESIRIISYNRLGMKHFASPPASSPKRSEFSPNLNRIRVSEGRLEQVYFVPKFMNHCYW